MGPYGAGLVIRLDPDGSLDSTFADSGIFQGESGSSFTHVAIDPSSGNVIALGGGSWGTIVRLDTDGELVDSFGTDGYAYFSGIGWFVDMAVQDDGKLLLATRHYWNTWGPTRKGRSNTGVTRLTTSGAADTSFDSDGQAVFTTDAKECDSPSDLELLEDGSIVIAGNQCTGIDSNGVWPTGTENTLAKLTSAGALDASFSADGIATSSPISYTPRVVGTDDGKLVMAGEKDGGGALRISRWSGGGALDTSYGTSGHADLNLATDESVTDVVALANGAVAVVGTSHYWDCCDIRDYIVAVVDDTGDLDDRFSGSGVATTGYFDSGQTRDDEGSAIAVSPDGTIVAAGRSDSRISVARYFNVPELAP